MFLLENVKEPDSNHNVVQAMSANPYPVCARPYCGFPISGCRHTECGVSKCREEQVAQGVELCRKPVNEFEFLDKFDSEEPRWRSCCRSLHPPDGFQPPFRPSRHYIAPNDTLECHAIPNKEERWRASHKYVSGGSGAMSENWRSSSRHINPGHGCCETNRKPCLKQFDVCEQTSLEADYRAGLKCFKNLSSKETMQGDFHPTLRYIPRGESEPPHWHRFRGPGEFKCKDQWLPPFRDPSPELVCGTAPGCISWQCPKRGKRCTSSRNDEWHPRFLGDNVGNSPLRESISQGGFRTCMQQTPRVPDEWQPPWKQGGDVQYENQEQFPPPRCTRPNDEHIHKDMELQGKWNESPTKAQQTFGDDIPTHETPLGGFQAPMVKDYEMLDKDQSS